MKIFELTIFGFTIAPSYYGLMYALGFILAYLIILKRKKIEKGLVDDLFLYVFAGVILGGRLGYILFYNLSSYLENPLHILRIWEGGMSFHGGMLGVILAVYLFHKIKKVSFLKVMDEIALTVPIGIGLGRVGNYINGELLGFAGYTGPLSINGRFPSPLLEAFLEGFITLVVLFMVSKKQKFAGQLGALFLILYGFFRLLVEVFVRTPDAHIGYIFWYFSMGAILSSAMIIVGGINYYILRKK